MIPSETNSPSVIYIYLIKHVSAEGLTTGRIIPLETNSPSIIYLIKHVSAQGLTTGRMIPSETNSPSVIYISNKTCQCRRTDYWADDTLGD
jgi:hypothetical protein